MADTAALAAKLLPPDVLTIIARKARRNYEAERHPYRGIAAELRVTAPNARPDFYGAFIQTYPFEVNGSNYTIQIRDDFMRGGQSLLLCEDDDAYHPLVGACVRGQLSSKPTVTLGAIRYCSGYGGRDNWRERASECSRKKETKRAAVGLLTVLRRHFPTVELSDSKVQFNNRGVLYEQSVRAYLYGADEMTGAERLSSAQHDLFVLR
jgi:hypothetical protein